MHDLANFTLGSMAECGAALRGLGASASSMEGVAQEVVRYLFDDLMDPAGQRALVLARFFKTVPYSGLGAAQQAFARSILGAESPQPGMKCLALLATAGVKPAWNLRTESRSHGAIPVASERMLSRFPMISQLLTQMGLRADAFIETDPRLLIEMDQSTYNVFHVADVRDSPFVPAQDEFVKPFSVRSVVGGGGMLPSGNFFAIILFSKTPIDAETAQLFRPMAVNVKVAVLPFVGGRTFE